jgi:hypothetical protein
MKMKTIWIVTGTESREYGEYAFLLGAFGNEMAATAAADKWKASHSEYRNPRDWTRYTTVSEYVIGRALDDYQIGGFAE